MSRSGPIYVGLYTWYLGHFESDFQKHITDRFVFSRPFIWYQARPHLKIFIIRHFEWDQWESIFDLIDLIMTFLTYFPPFRSSRFSICCFGRHMGYQNTKIISVAITSRVDTFFHRLTKLKPVWSKRLSVSMFDQTT